MLHGRAEPDGAAQEDSSAGTVVRRALVRFALLSLVAVALVTVATLVIADRIARGMALDDARSQGAAIAHRLAAPLVDEYVRAGVPGAADQLTTVMANRAQDGSVQHVKIWDEHGVIIWSDQPELVGRRFELSAPVAELFGTTEVTAGVSGADLSEGVGEQDEQELLDVYAGAFDRDGEPVVVEAYLRTGPMEDNARTIVTSFVPLIVGSLVLLLLLLLPLAVSLSRRVQRAQTERATMMRHALLASDLERRRIAEDLHHGVVQQLAGLSYALPTVARHLDDGGDVGAARSLLDRATNLVERNVVALRSLMTDIYPPDLDSGGLRDGIQQLVHTEALNADIKAHIRMADDVDLPPDAARLAYRIIREGTRNVVKHAGADEIVVELTATGSDVVVRVIDDGRGPGARPGHSPRGHLGLRLLRDTVRDFGGRLDVRSRAVGGTELVAEFPVALVRS